MSVCTAMMRILSLARGVDRNSTKFRPQPGGRLAIVVSAQGANFDCIVSVVEGKGIKWLWQASLFPGRWRVPFLAGSSNPA